MTRSTALALAIRDSMLIGWLVLGALTLAIVFSIRAGITWRTGIPAMLAVPVVIHLWARALCRLENASRG
jgi:hypothetical protein